MTHDELCARAAKWLANTKRCTLVCREVVSGVLETPDAIGWSRGWSYLVECKTSRSDFSRDRQKPCRRVNSMGAFRYYLTPPGLLSAYDLPEGWGLLECGAKAIRVAREAVEQVLSPSAFRSELVLQARAIRMVNGGDALPVKRSAVLVSAEGCE